jgi:hypothetical protein
MHPLAQKLTIAAAFTGLLATSLPAQLPDPLPRPDGKKADMSKPVHVYILMGQSNMLGFGKVGGLKDACVNKGLYPYLIEDDGSWTVRKDVRFTRVMCSGPGPRKIHNNDWMTIKRANIGPEMGIGHYVGHVTKAPVLILKSCIGNRSLGWDLLPPTADGYSGNKKGPREPIPGDWYAGMQYDGDVRAAHEVLKQIGKYYPGATRYEVKGFFYWQGDKDFRNAEHAAAYEKNLLCLIESLRIDFKAPKAKFVCATLGQTKKGAGGAQGKILDAQLNIDGKKGKYKKHRGMVASVYSHPLSMGGSSSGHYSGNAETYMNIGQAMGQAMARLIMNSPDSIPGVDIDAVAGSLKGAYKNILGGKWASADATLRGFIDGPGASDPDQLMHAVKLTEYLSGQVDGFLGEMQACNDVGDFCRLRDGLATTGKGCVGLAAYDGVSGAWQKALETDEAKQAMAAGDALGRLLAKKKRMKPGAYFAAITAFQDKFPGSFYAQQGDEELAPTRAALKKLFDEAQAFEQRGDIYSKYELIQASRGDFAKILEFDVADQAWAAEAKEPAVRQQIAAGAAYAAVMKDLAKVDKRFKDDQAKNKKITGRNKREKMEKKAKANYQKALKSIASKLEKIHKKHGDSYYGHAAFRTRESWVNSYGRELIDELSKKK